MKRPGRRGFFLIWAALSVCIVLILGGALMALVGTAVRYMSRSQERTDAVLIGQEVMEILKTNRRFHTRLPIPEEMDRNGRIYRIEVMRTMEMMEGLPLEKASVIVQSPNESVTFQHVLGRRGGSYGE